MVDKGATARIKITKPHAISDRLRHIIETAHYAALAANAHFSTYSLPAVPPKYRFLIPDYVKDRVSLNLFVT